MGLASRVQHRLQQGLARKEDQEDVHLSQSALYGASRIQDTTSYLYVFFILHQFMWSTSLHEGREDCGVYAFKDQLDLKGRNIGIMPYRELQIVRDKRVELASRDNPQSRFLAERCCVLAFSWKVAQYSETLNNALFNYKFYICKSIWNWYNIAVLRELKDNELNYIYRIFLIIT